MPLEVNMFRCPSFRGRIKFEQRVAPTDAHPTTSAPCFHYYRLYCAKKTQNALPRLSVVSCTVIVTALRALQGGSEHTGSSPIRWHHC